MTETRRERKNIFFDHRFLKFISLTLNYYCLPRNRPKISISGSEKREKHSVHPASVMAKVLLITELYSRTTEHVRAIIFIITGIIILSNNRLPILSTYRSRRFQNPTFNDVREARRNFFFLNLPLTIIRNRI